MNEMDKAPDEKMVPGINAGDHLFGYAAVVAKFAV